MSNNFPFIPATLTETETTEVVSDLPIFCEIAYDIDTETTLTKAGQNYYVYKNEALKIWIYKALKLQTTRYLFNAYSNNYGNEFGELIGRALPDTIMYSEIERLITEALLVNPYINSCNNFEFEKKGSRIYVGFVCNTIYGEINNKMEYLL